MKINELRIGNYVNWKEELACIAQILELDVCFKCGDIGLLKDLYPIPLTEEWLEDLGFDKITKNVFKINLGYSCCFKTLKIYLLNGQIDIEDDCLCHIPVFVHSLQNLCFALTGEELIIF